MNCEKCANESICKFEDDAKELEADVQEISKKIRPNNPITISMVCQRYQGKLATKSSNPFILQQQENRPGIYYRD